MASRGEQELQFAARDGFELSGTLVRSRNPERPSIQVLICSGGGISSTRYLNFARYLADAGCDVLLFDYRGIGKSRPRTLRGFRAALEDWSEFDCAGAIDFLRERIPESEIVAVVHSIGAVVALGSPNAAAIARFVIFGGHTGFYGDYRRRYRIPMTVVWHGVMPLLAKCIGYFPGRILRLGGDLPKGVALQWASRLGPAPVSTKYRVRHPRFGQMVDRCKSVTAGALAISFTDDAFATAAGLLHLLQMAPRLDVKLVTFSPRELEVGRLGHLAYLWTVAARHVWCICLEFVLGAENARRPNGAGPARELT